MKQVLAAIAALAVGLFTPALAEAATQISVTGTGTIAMMPDEATVNASIVTNDPNAETATSKNNAAYEKAVRELTARGINRNDITLSYYNVSYQPKPQNAPPAPPEPGTWGYTVNRSFAVKIHEISKAGQIVDTLAPTPGIEISGVTFGLSDTTAARKSATSKAVADARSKAQAVAAAAGLHITNISRIDLEGAYPGPIPMVRTMNAATLSAKVPTEFDTGNVNVTVNVSVIFSASQ